MGTNTGGFVPTGGNVSITIAATAATATITPGKFVQLLLQNVGTPFISVAIGTAAITATAGSTASFVMAPNSHWIVTPDPTAVTISAVGTAGGTLYITPGIGQIGS